jgi:plastocyanin
MIKAKVIVGVLLIANFGAGGILAEAAEKRPDAIVLQTSPGPTGALVGRVSVVGNLQKPKPLQVFKNRGVCGATVPNETLLISADGGVRNAVVLLRPLDRRAPAQPEPLVLDNRQCAFAPHVQVAAVGSELLLKNSDPILHTVHARLGMETLFNVGLPKWREVTKRLDRVGVVRINCDVLHTWMSAAIVVTDSRYFVVSDEKGLFRFDGIATGDYEIEIWHERLGSQYRRISVGEAATTDVDIVYALGNKQ